MEFSWSWGSGINIASGATMALLGGALLVANPRKDWNRIFALFAVFWGVQIVSLNMVRVATTEALAQFAVGLSLAFLLPLYFFLVSFASIFPRPRPPFGTSPLAVALLMVPAAATLVILFLKRSWLVSDVALTSESYFTAQWGPLLPYLVTAPFYGAVFFALFAMMQRLGESESAIERKQIAFVLAAIGIFAAYYTPFLLHLFGRAALGLDPADEAARAEAILFALVMLAGLALLATLALRLSARARDAPGEPERREARSVLAVLGIAFATGLAAIALRSAIPGLDLDIALLGVARLASVALVVYAIVRFQLFDVDLRVKRVAAGSAAGLAGIALAAAAWIALSRASVPASVGGALSAAAAVLAFLPLLRVSSAIADRVAPAVSREGDHLYLRKLEVYRAAIETLGGKGVEPRPEEPSLVELRSKLGLSERDHGVVVSLAATRAEPPASPELKPGGVVFGKYEIDSMLAEGGFGRVFLARDRILGRAVVIKELQAKWRGDPNVVRTFLREAQIAGRLQHPNIVTILEVEQHAQDYFVVMEHVAGGSLEERIASGRLPLGEALRIAGAMLAGLAAAHAVGVVHRDVKPANVLLGSRGEVKLADFGIAQFTGEADAARTISGLTTGGFAPGTIQYMSPEQARGLPLDARSDVYAAGAVLYRMLSGRPHVDVARLDELDARTAVANAATPAPVAGVPEGVNAALRKALARESADRFASAGEFADALARVPARA